MIFRVEPLLYKVGHLNKYFYLSSSGEWQLSNNQTEIDLAFKMSQKKEPKTNLSKAAIGRLRILDKMKNSEPKTRREIAAILDMDELAVKHRLQELKKSGDMVLFGERRCSIFTTLNRNTLTYKLA
jgi:predicted HTH transcriptional regulator|tara:strand:+ start:824 stop:1201 length:378 start_codon:yes stop_codon:yes gene_type:complete